MAIESIYDLVQETPPAPYKPPRHKSIHNPKVKPSWSRFNCHTMSRGVCNVGGNDSSLGPLPQADKTFGTKPGSNKADVCTYLKKTSLGVETSKHMKTKCPEAFMVSENRQKGKMKASLPTRDDKPLMNLVTSKNFIVANAVENILAQPKKVPEAEMRWTQKEDYGRVPEYLPTLKEGIAAEREMIMGMMAEQMEHANPNMQKYIAPLDDDKRIELLHALKAKWEVTNQSYQTHTHLTQFSRGQLHQKESHEKLLTDLEKKIELLSKSNVCVNLDA